jgi:hypothetical protein
VKRNAAGQAPERSGPAGAPQRSASGSASTAPPKQARKSSTAPAAAGARKSRADHRPADAVKPEKSTALPADAVRKTGDEFGIEGTNKTVATPKPDHAAPDELGLGPHIEKTPYTRG